MSQRLHVGIADLPSLRVAHKLCIFTTKRTSPDRVIRRAFKALREWVTEFGLDPNALLHIGIPQLDGPDLVTYDCCIEFPLPIEEEGRGIRQKSLPGGKYAVLRVEKNPHKIARAIRQFHGDHIPEHQIVPDGNRPTYEIYYEDTLEYCVPIIDG